MKNKKIISIISAAALLFTACNSDNEDTPSATADENVTESSVTESAVISEEETTTARVSAVEDQPENTSAVTTPSAPEDITSTAPDGFPAPYPAGAADAPELLAEFKEKSLPRKPPTAFFTVLPLLYPTWAAVRRDMYP